MFDTLAEQRAAFLRAMRIDPADFRWDDDDDPAEPAEPERKPPEPDYG